MKVFTLAFLWFFQNMFHMVYESLLTFTAHNVSGAPNTNECDPPPIAIWVRKVVDDMYAARDPVRPSLQELIWHLRNGSWFTDLMAMDTPPSSMHVSPSGSAVRNAVVALSTLLRAIEENGPCRIPFDIDRLADLRHILDGNADPIAVCNWMRIFRSPVVCTFNINTLLFI